MRGSSRQPALFGTAVALVGSLSFGCGGDVGIDTAPAGSTGDAPSGTATTEGSSETGEPTGDGVPEDPCASIDDPTDQIVRRLTRAEYANTIEDVLGLDVRQDVEALLPPDLRVDGFDNTASAQIVTFDHVEGYHELARTIVARLDLPAVTAAHASCTSFESACETAVVESLGEVIWRRPLSAEEASMFGPVFDAAQEEGDDFATAVGLVLRTMLASPQFLYRLEDQTPADDGGPTRVLTDYELASRLSYLVWGSAPDDELYALAKAGQLQDTETIEAQVLRMLEHPRARETSIRYVTQWLALDELTNIRRDPNYYPDFSPELGAQMAEETRRLFEYLLWEERAPLHEILSTDFTILSPDLATLYGLQPAGEGWQHYDVGTLPERVGVLTHAGVLTINAQGNRPSIVERGLFILRSVLCGEMVPPPTNVDTSMPDVDENASEREKSDLRLSDGNCAGCHGQFDPLAYAFEQFDAAGGVREQDTLGNPIRTDGWFVRPSDGEAVPYDNVAELVALIADDAAARSCVGVKKPLQYAVGHRLGPADACVAESIEAALRPEGGPDGGPDGGTYEDLMVALATSPSFRRIRTP